MQGVDRLWAGYREFQRDRYTQQRDLFRKLASGQNPEVMIIACADSRADPAMIFSAAPGELFVLRNVANLVPAFEKNSHFGGTAAALEFAINNLRVQHIVVMGHASCGGIDACLGRGDGQPIGGFISSWVSMLDDIRDELTNQHAHASEDALRLAMEQRSVAFSIANIKTYSFAKKAIAEGRLELHGAWFSIASGELNWRDPKTGMFDPVPLVPDQSD